MNVRMNMLRGMLSLTLFIATAPLEMAVAAPRAALVVAVDPMLKNLQDRQGEDFEAVFLAFLIHHHQAGIRMAALVEERGMDPGLKLEAQTLISINKRQIEQMEQWLEQWHPRKPGEDMIPQASKDQELQEIAELEKVKDSRFDKLFIAYMARHQETAIQMARLAAAHAVHEEVKAFASRVVDLHGEFKGTVLK